MPPISNKARAAFLVIGALGMLSVGASRSETVIKSEPVRIRIVEHVKWRTKTVVKTVTAPARPPSGFVTVDDCHSIKVGMRFQDLIYTYGWPAYDEGDTYSGFFDYPIVGNHDRTCSVDIISHKVASATLR